LKRIPIARWGAGNVLYAEEPTSARSQDLYRVMSSVMATSWLKRALDIIGSCVLLILCSPILLGIAVAIWLIDSGPVLFTWNILGLGGKPIRSYKFRTMVPSAEEIETTLRVNGWNEMGSVYFKTRNDPRVTAVGRMLRRFSLDELPSLWSVLKGDMSLVGPRPVRVVEVPYLKPWHAERFSVRPGLTSPWVVSGKTTIRDFDVIASCDIEYIRHWTFWRDCKVLAATVGYMLMGRNY
jgi:lipopolysaccharide/colanic/teichoic acid biosynthesis glycosyltransferase